MQGYNILHPENKYICLRRDGDLDLNTRLQTDRCNLLDNLAGRVEVNKALVNLELVAVPGLGTFTTRSLTSGDLENLGGQTDGSLDTELLVLGTVDEVVRELFQVLDIAARQRDTDFVDFSGGHGGTGSIVFFFSFSDVAHDCR